MIRAAALRPCIGDVRARVGAARRGGPDAAPGIGRLVERERAALFVGQAAESQHGDP